MPNSTVPQLLNEYVTAVSDSTPTITDYQNASRYLSQVFDSLISNPNPQDLNATWEFFLANQNTYAQESIALTGIGVLLPAERFTYQFLYSLFRQCSFGQTFSSVQTMSNIIVSCALTLQFLQEQVTTINTATTLPLPAVNFNNLTPATAIEPGDQFVIIRQGSSTPLALPSNLFVPDLSAYVTDTALNTAVSGLVTSSQMDLYVTGAIATAIANFATTTQLNAAVSGLTTLAQVDAEIGTATANLVTTTQLNTAVSGLTTVAAVDTEINNAIANDQLATTSNIDAAIAAQASADSAQYETATQVDAAIQDAMGTPTILFGGAPSSGTVGLPLATSHFTGTTPGQLFYTSITINGVEQLPRVLAIDINTSGVMTPLTAGTATVGIYETATGEPALATSASFTIVVPIVATAVTLAGVPPTATVGHPPFYGSLAINATPSDATFYISVTGANTGEAMIPTAFTMSNYGNFNFIPEAADSYTFNIYADPAGTQLLASGGPLVVS